MIFTVGWNRSAERELTELWLKVEDRNAVTAAVYQIDSRLRTQPDRSFPQKAPSRVLVVPPLVVEFDLSEPDRTVTITAVGMYDDDPDELPRE